MEQIKVFGIGLNKTGTSSLDMALRLLGFKHKSWEPKPFRQYVIGDYHTLMATAEMHDSFTDWPWPLLVPELLEHFGTRARFILTKRASDKVWLDSLKKHAMSTAPKNNPRKDVFGYAYPHENEQAHLDYYNAHLDKIRTLFAEHGAEDQLIELCWEDGDGWEALCGFLDRPQPPLNFPHKNARSARDADKSTAKSNKANLRARLGRRELPIMRALIRRVVPS